MSWGRTCLRVPLLPEDTAWLAFMETCQSNEHLLRQARLAALATVSWALGWHREGMSGYTCIFQDEGGDLSWTTPGTLGFAVWL